MRIRFAQVLALASVLSGSMISNVFADQNARMVYTMSNASSGNAVLAYEQRGDALIPAGSFPTQGTGSGGGPGNITGFELTSRNILKPIPGSTRSLSGAATAPAQIELNPEGNALVVTEKATQIIDTYIVDEDGVAAGPISQPSSGVTPFGFAFNTRGVLIVSEAFGGTANASAFLYVLNTIARTIDVFRVDRGSGELTHLTSISGLPAGANGLVVQ